MCSAEPRPALALRLSSASSSVSPLARLLCITCLQPQVLQNQAQSESSLQRACSKITGWGSVIGSLPGSCSHWRPLVEGGRWT